MLYYSCVVRDYKGVLGLPSRPLQYDSQVLANLQGAGTSGTDGTMPELGPRVLEFRATVSCMGTLTASELQS